MDIKPITLTGTNVELVPMEEKHAEGIFEAGSFPEIWEVTQGVIASLSDAEAYVKKALGQPAALPFVITERATGRVLGSTRFSIFPWSIKDWKLARPGSRHRCGERRLTRSANICC